MVRRHSPLLPAPAALRPSAHHLVPAPAGYLYHQKDMLQDRGRMDGYRNAILQNPDCFKDEGFKDLVYKNKERMRTKPCKGQGTAMDYFFSMAEAGAAGIWW